MVRQASAKASDGQSSRLITGGLLGERLLKVAEQVRSGASLPLPTELRWADDLAATVRDGVQAWLRTGEWDYLLRLLERAPQALAHPVTTLLLNRLRRLARRVEEELIGAPVLLAGEVEPVPEGTCRAAQVMLERLAGAVVSGLFPTPGWGLQSARRRGRPRRTLSDLVDAHLMLEAYNEVLAHLRRHKPEFRRRRNETEQDLTARLTELIRRAWIDSGIGIHIGATAPESGDPLDLTTMRIIQEPFPLPDRVSKRAAREAAKLAAERRPYLDHIAYSLVGHRWGCKAPSTVKKYIQRARSS